MGDFALCVPYKCESKKSKIVLLQVQQGNETAAEPVVDSATDPVEDSAKTIDPVVDDFPDVGDDDEATINTPPVLITDVPGYRIHEDDLEAPNFKVQSLCSEGWTGEPTVTECDRPFGPYTITGCTKNRDCAYTWTRCNSACERTLKILQPPQGNGALCPMAEGTTAECAAGEDDCLYPLLSDGTKMVKGQVRAGRA